MYREFAELEERANGSCPICKAWAYKNSNSPGGDTLVVCPICGKFRLSFDGLNLLHGLEASGDDRRYRISRAMRIVSERALGLRDNSFFPLYSSEDFERILDGSDLTVPDKVQALLTYVGKLTEYPGQTIGFDAKHDYPILNAKNPEEADFYLLSLQEQRLLSTDEHASIAYRGGPNAPYVEMRPVKVSTQGWLELDRIAQSGAESSSVFIAMWFDPSRRLFEEAINAAINVAGYTPIRVDRVEHLNRIDDEIIAQIRRARFLIADLTGQRNGVYFEAGLMMGLGRAVIWLCDKSDILNVHFDTRQYNTIDYSDAEELKSRLQFRIEANFGKGPHSKS